MDSLNFNIYRFYTELSSGCLYFPFSCDGYSNYNGYLLFDTNLEETPIYYNILNYNKPILIPLSITHYNSTVTTKRRVSKIIETTHNLGLVKMQTKNGIYFINRGVILDSAFNLLLLATYTYKNGAIDSFTLYVSPSVLNNQSLFMEKIIMKDIIPLTITWAEATNLKYKICIENLNRFILKPTELSDIRNLDININKMLLENVHKLDEQ